MKCNKILAATVAAALAAPLQAFADTANFNWYGNFDVSDDSINTGTATKGTPGTTSNRVSSNTSFIGVKGSVAAGDGLSAIWQVESLLSLGDSAANGTNGTGYLANRNSFVGLKSDRYGTIFAGRNDTPYKLSTRLFDQFDRGIADNRSIMGGSTGASAKSSFDGRQDQVVAYVSPSLEGVTVAAAHVNLSPTVSTGGTFQGSAISVAAWYNANGLYATLAYELHDLQAQASGTGSEHATKLGLGYTQEGAYTVGFAAEQTSDNLGAAAANLYGHNAYYVSGRFYVGSAGAIKAAFTDASNLAGGNAANTGARQYSLGYDYILNKNVTVYALYTKLSNESAAGYSLSVSNGTAASIGGPSTISGIGASPSALGVGVLVTF